MRAWPVLVGAVALWSCVGTVRGGPVFARTAAETNAGLQGAIFAGVGDTVGDVGVVVSGHAGRGLTAERWFGSLLGGLGGRISWRTTDAFRVGGWVELLAGRTFASDGGPLVQIRLGPVLSSALALSPA